MHPTTKEKWDHLFGDVVADGVDCVAPSMDPSIMNVAQCGMSIEGEEEVGEEEDESVATMNVINHMVVDGVLLKGNDLWCYSHHLLENVVRKEMFLNMEHDECRIT